MSKDNHQNKWLIRTKSKQILGPISRDKVKSFYQNGSLDKDDEICSGNGFWFWVREQELVEKFLINGETQSFNPVSEARNVLTPDTEEEEITDSEFEFSDDVTLIGTNLNDLELDVEKKEKVTAHEEEASFPNSSELEFPEVIKPDSSFEQEDELEPTQEIDLSSRKNFSEQAGQEEVEEQGELEKEPTLEEEEIDNTFVDETQEIVTHKKTRNDRYLFYLIFLILLILAGSFVFYRRVLRKPFPLFSSVINQAHAQELHSLGKKKV